MHAPTTSPPCAARAPGAIATLRFNRPEALNAIDVPMAQAFWPPQTIAADPGVRAGAARQRQGLHGRGDWPPLRPTRCRAPTDILTPSTRPCPCWPASTPPSLPRRTVWRRELTWRHAAG